MPRRKYLSWSDYTEAMYERGNALDANVVYVRYIVEWQTPVEKPRPGAVSSNTHSWKVFRRFGMTVAGIPDVTVQGEAILRLIKDLRDRHLPDPRIIPAARYGTAFNILGEDGKRAGGYEFECPRQIYFFDLNLIRTSYFSRHRTWGSGYDHQKEAEELPEPLMEGPRIDLLPAVFGRAPEIIPAPCEGAGPYQIQIGV